MQLPLTRRELMCSLKKFTSHGTPAFRGIFLVVVLELDPLVICRSYYFISPYMKIFQEDPSEHPAAFFLQYSCARSKRISFACTPTSFASQYMKRCLWVYTVGQNDEKSPILINSAGKVRIMQQLQILRKWQGFFIFLHYRTHLRHTWQ